MLRKAWAFVLVHGHSRHMVARIVFDQRIETWQWLHVEAFEELGGVPAVVVPDNLKSAVVRAAFGVGGATALNKSYRELARHYGFKVDPAPICQPKKKGKVVLSFECTQGSARREKPSTRATRPCRARGASAESPQGRRSCSEACLRTSSPSSGKRSDGVSARSAAARG